MDYERAETYEMPERNQTALQKHICIHQFKRFARTVLHNLTIGQSGFIFLHFLKMLTLEQYRDPKLAQLHHDYLAGGPLEYMAAIFRKLVDSDEDAGEVSAEFYGPMYLLMVYRSRGKESVFFFTGYTY